jgi:hypothetical protein
MLLKLRIIKLLWFACVLASCDPFERVTRFTTDEIVFLDSMTVMLKGTIHDLSKERHDAFGFCFATHPNPTIADSVISLTSDASQSFYVQSVKVPVFQAFHARTFIFDGEAIHYGEVKSVFPGDQFRFIDNRDGKVYRVVTIGNQTWLAENLNFNIGDSRCIDEDPECNLYGRVYSESHLEKIAPQGWHIPTKAEWDSVVNILGGYGFSSFNEMIFGGGSGFDIRLTDGAALFWSKSRQGPFDFWVFIMTNSYGSGMFTTAGAEFVRCVRD